MFFFKVLYAQVAKNGSFMSILAPPNRKMMLWHRIPFKLIKILSVSMLVFRFFIILERISGKFWGDLKKIELKIELRETFNKKVY